MVNEISAKIETYSVTKIKICLVKYEDYKEIFFLASRRCRRRPRLLKVPLHSETSPRSCFIIPCESYFI